MWGLNLIIIFTTSKYKEYFDPQIGEDLELEDID